MISVLCLYLRHLSGDSLGLEQRDINLIWIKWSVRSKVSEV
jgi:hypothetical protein